MENKTIDDGSLSFLKIERNKEFKQGIAAWLGWCKYSNSINLLNKIAYERCIL